MVAKSKLIPDFLAVDRCRTVVVCAFLCFFYDFLCFSLFLCVRDGVLLCFCAIFVDFCVLLCTSMYFYVFLVYLLRILLLYLAFSLVFTVN